MMKLNSFFVLLHIAFSECLTCKQILEFPPIKKISIYEIQSVPPKDIIRCLTHLSKEKLPLSQADFIWKSIIKFYNGTANVPQNVIMSLHWVTPALTPEDYNNITFNNIDVIRNFGLNYDLNDAQLTAIADRIREDFASKEPEDYTFYDLAALRQVLCTFNRSEIERMHPSAYKEAAVIIGKLENCDPEVMNGFATLAVKRSAFGHPEKWSKSVVEIIGEVAKFVPETIVTKHKQVNK